MKNVWSVLLLGLAHAGCNYDVGECYVRGEGEDSAGSGVITPAAGAGGYGSTPPGGGGFGGVPLETQDRRGFPSPCDGQLAECTVTWRADSGGCKPEGTANTCTTLYQGHHASLDEAKARCENAYGVTIGGAESCGSCKWVTDAKDDPVEKCKKVCDQQYEECCKPCTTKECYAACMDVYKKCLKNC